MTTVAERFFMAFATSARTHVTEQVVRLLVSASLIIHSAAMWQPKVFWFVGWAIALSSVALILTPWQWHHHFGEKVRPMLIRRMKVYAVGLLAFGVLNLCGVHWSLPNCGITGRSRTAHARACCYRAVRIQGDFKLKAAAVSGEPSAAIT